MLSGVTSNSPRYRTSPSCPSSAIATAFRDLATSIPTYASVQPVLLRRPCGLTLDLRTGIVLARPRANNLTVPGHGRLTSSDPPGSDAATPPQGARPRGSNNPVAIAKGHLTVGVAEVQKVVERVDPRSGHVRMGLKVEVGVESGTRIMPLTPADLTVVLQRIDVGRTCVRVGREVTVTVEPSVHLCCCITPQPGGQPGVNKPMNLIKVCA